MSVIDRLDSDLKEALKSRNEVKLSTIRMLKASLKNKSIEKMSSLTDDDIISVLSSASKQRRESIDQYTAAGRSDLAAKELKELEIIQSYLPKQLSNEDIDVLIKNAISESRASSPADMGKVMKIVSLKTKGIADGKFVSQRVRELLGG